MILITGGTGFLGSYIARYLVAEDRPVRLLVRSSSSMDLIADIQDRVEFVEGDILDVCSLEKALQDVDQVYHSAAVVSFNRTTRQKMMKVNIEGTANVVNIALDAGVRRLLHVSSIAALGRKEQDEEIDEHTKWENSKLNTSYAISKYQAEREVWRGFAEGLGGLIVNPSLIIGGGYWDVGTARIFNRIYEGLSFYTLGRTGYIDVRDVARLCIALMDSAFNKERFILSAENLYLKDFAQAIAGELGKKPPSIAAGPFLLALAWRWEVLKSLVSGSEPLLTKEAATIANARCSYRNDKVKQSLKWDFIPIKQTIKETCEALVASKQRGEAWQTLPLNTGIRV